MTTSDVDNAITDVPEEFFNSFFVAVQEDKLPADLAARLRRTFLEKDFIERSITAALFAEEKKL